MGALTLRTRQGIVRRVFAFKRKGATVYYRCETCGGISQKTYKNGRGRTSKPNEWAAGWFLKYHRNGCQARCLRCERIAKADDELAEAPS